MEDDNYCDECGEDIGNESHYHCAYCREVCGMMGHQDCFEKANGPIEPLPEACHEPCPKCGNMTVFAKWAGGVACSTKDCGYWFCY